MARNIVEEKRVLKETQDTISADFAKSVEKLTAPSKDITPREIDDAADEFAKKFWKNNRNTHVELSPDEVARLNSREFNLALRKSPSREVQEAIDVGKGEGASVRLEALDNLRKDLSSAAGQGGSAEYAGLAREVSEILGDNAVGFDDYITGYAALKKYGEGAAAGAKILSTSADEADALLRTSSSETVDGFKEAAARKIQQKFQSDKGAASFAEKLYYDKDLQRRVSSVLGKEYDELFNKASQYVKAKDSAALRYSDKVSREKAALEDYTTEARKRLNKVIRDSKNVVDRSKSTGARKLRESVDVGESVLTAPSEDFAILDRDWETRITLLRRFLASVV